ncbi:MAG TPA: ABC transporter substrate-binding protein [Burkholderiales bacterium]|nr:ABC transporter substrate-binding protein [Burkholderiales bacterium]
MKRLFAAAMLAGAFAGTALGEDAYVIGVTAGMTGPASGNFVPVIEPLRAYVEHLNTRGGIHGKPVRLIVLDDSAEPSKAAANVKRLINQDKVILLINSSLSSTYAPSVAEAKRAKVPLYYVGAVCPKETFPPADPLQFCSTAFGVTYDSQAAIGFIKSHAQGPVKLGLAAMAIPVARMGIDFAEKVASAQGFKVVDKEITPPPTPDYTPFATRLKDADPNWVFSWSPWVSQVRTFEALRRLGWGGRYLTWAHLNAEEELARIKDDGFYVIGSNAFFQDDLPIHAEIRAVAHRGNVNYPTTYLTEGFIGGLVLEQILKNTPWPPSPAKVLAAMNRVQVDLKGLRGGPLAWTKDNHFRTTQYYRVWHWDEKQGRIVRVEDWIPIQVK